MAGAQQGPGGLDRLGGGRRRSDGPGRVCDQVVRGVRMGMMVRKTDVMMVMMQVLQRVQRAQIRAQSRSHGRTDQITRSSSSAASSAAAVGCVLRLAFDVAVGRLRRRFAADGHRVQQGIGRRQVQFAPRRRRIGFHDAPASPTRQFVNDGNCSFLSFLKNSRDPQHSTNHWSTSSISSSS